MKRLALIGLAVCMHVAVFSQTSAVVDNNKLQIPVNPKEGVINISKTNLSKVEFITTSNGKVEGYTIGFKMDDASYFSKKSELENLDVNVRNRLIGLPSGNHFYLYEVKMKTTDKVGLGEKTYEFVITD